MIWRCFLRVIPLTREALARSAAHVERRAVEADVNIDNSRTILNRFLLGSGSIESDCQKTLAGYKNERTGKSPSPIVGEFVLSASADFFSERFHNWQTDPVVLNDWITRNRDFMSRCYGDNLIEMALHLDEESPHFHAFVVPLVLRTYVSTNKNTKEQIKTQKKVISYGTLFTDRYSALGQARQAGTSEDTKLGKIQSAYAEAMEPLGLARGIRKSTKTNKSPKKYRQDIQSAPYAPLEFPADLRKLEKITLNDVICNKIPEKNARNADVFAGLTSTLDSMLLHINKTNSLLHENAHLNQEVMRLTRDLMRESSMNHNLVVATRKQKNLDIQFNTITYDHLSEKFDIGADVHQRVVKILESQHKCLIQYISLAYEGSGLTVFDAICLLFEYFPDIAPLAVQRFASQIATGILSQHPQNFPQRNLTPTEIRAGACIRKQFESLGLINCRIVLSRHCKGTGKPNETETIIRHDALQQYYRLDQLNSIVPFLLYQNRNGYNIGFIPEGGIMAYSGCVETSEIMYQKFEEIGFPPSLVLDLGNDRLKVISKFAEGNDITALLKHYPGLFMPVSEEAPIPMAGFVWLEVGSDPTPPATTIQEFIGNVIGTRYAQDVRSANPSVQKNSMEGSQTRTITNIPSRPKP